MPPPPPPPPLPERAATPRVRPGAPPGSCAVRPQNCHPPAPTVTSAGLQSCAGAQGHPADRIWAEANGHKPKQYGDHTLHGQSDADEARFGARPTEAEGRTEAERPPAPGPPGGLQPRPRDRAAHRPPPPPIPPAPDRPGRLARPQGGTQPRARHEEKVPGRIPPEPARRSREGGRKSGGAQTPWNGPTSTLHRNDARCARHTDLGRGGGRRRRASASGHTRKGHARRT